MTPQIKRLRDWCEQRKYGLGPDDVVHFLRVSDIEFLCEGMERAERLISLYVSDASDGRAMECAEWLSKFGEGGK